MAKCVFCEYLFSLVECVRGATCHRILTQSHSKVRLLFGQSGYIYIFAYIRYTEPNSYAIDCIFGSNPNMFQPQSPRTMRPRQIHRITICKKKKIGYAFSSTNSFHSCRMNDDRIASLFCCGLFSALLPIFYMRKFNYAWYWWVMPVMPVIPRYAYIHAVELRAKPEVIENIYTQCVWCLQCDGRIVLDGVWLMMNGYGYLYDVDGGWWRFGVTYV